MNDKFNYINSIEEKLIKYRRDFHKYAESAWSEFRTTSKIIQILKEL